MGGADGRGYVPNLLLKKANGAEEDMGILLSLSRKIGYGRSDVDDGLLLNVSAARCITVTPLSLCAGRGHVYDILHLQKMV